jgi:hypothetical protein
MSGQLPVVCLQRRCSTGAAGEGRADAGCIVNTAKDCKLGVGTVHKLKRKMVVAT